MTEIEKMYHIDLKKGEVGRYVFLPGDPGRVPKIAAFLDGAREVAHKREYRTFTGTLLGEKVSVTSTGIGCPSAAIAVEELAMIGADTFIRVGTAGIMQPERMQRGDLVITTAAVRHEYTSSQYIPMAYPAVADLDVTLALREAARSRGVRHHVGITQSKDSFFGQHEPERMPVGARLMYEWDAWVKGGVLCSEMEASILFVVSRILGKRAGGIMMTASSSDPLDALIGTAIDGVKLLIERDRADRGG
jgi:uridine phosphorylase